MTIKEVDQLPKEVRESLPEAAQKIYFDAYNRAWEQYEGEDDREAAAHREAWKVVQESYRQDEQGRWMAFPSQNE